MECYPSNSLVTALQQASTLRSTEGIPTAGPLATARSKRDSQAHTISLQWSASLILVRTAMQLPPHWRIVCIRFVYVSSAIRQQLYIFIMTNGQYF